MEDSKILELFFARDENAIKHTDDTYGRRLYHLADNIVKNGQDAEVVSLTEEMEARELGRLLDCFLRTRTPENQMVLPNTPELIKVCVRSLNCSANLTGNKPPVFSDNRKAAARILAAALLLESTF
ncbi:MAG: hypothetical protein ACI3V0_04065 [Faecousia sp.]